MSPRVSHLSVLDARIFSPLLLRQAVDDDDLEIVFGTIRAAAIVGCGRKTILRLARSGELPHKINSDGEHVFKKRDLVALLKKREPRARPRRRKRLRLENPEVTVEKVLALLDLRANQASMEQMIRETRLLPSQIRFVFQEIATDPLKPVVLSKPIYVRPDGKRGPGRPTKEEAAARKAAAESQTEELTPTPLHEIRARQNWPKSRGTP